MDNKKGLPIRNEFNVMTLILNEHQTKHFMHIIKEKNLYDGIMLLAKGTVKNSFLNLIGLKNQNMTIIDVLIPKDKSKEIIDYTSEKLKLNEKDHGIAYLTSPKLAGHGQAEGKILKDMGAKKMFKKLTVIVNRGMADDVMDIARESGAKGGTVLHGRGTGSEKATKLFGIEVEPEKELVLIVIPSEIEERVVSNLYEKLEMQNAGNGILFVEDITDVRGIVN